MSRFEELIYFLVKCMFKNLSERHLQLIAQIIRFGCVGVVNTTVSYLTIVICLLQGLDLLVSNAIAFLISVACAYYLNNYFVFKTQTVWWKGLLSSYCTYAFTGLGVNSVLLYYLTNILDFSDYIAPLICLCVTIPCNFLLNKFITFKDNRKSNVSE